MIHHSSVRSSFRFGAQFRAAHFLLRISRHVAIPECGPNFPCKLRIPISLVGDGTGERGESRKYALKEKLKLCRAARGLLRDFLHIINALLFAYLMLSASCDRLTTAPVIEARSLR
jgi:hypothetical protein